MASYLLKADDEDMARWRAQAAEAGMSFAMFVRSSLNGYGRTLARRAPEDAPVPPPAPPPPLPRPPSPPVAVDLGLRDVTPLFKPERKR